MGDAMTLGLVVTQLDRFVDEHLTAASLMVPLDAPLAAETRASDARDYLREQDFDLAVVELPRLQIVTRGRLERLPDSGLDRRIQEVAETPRRIRLIEPSLPIRKVARRLLADEEPLLVVGEGGVTHIVTLADFASVAGTAVVLAFLLAVDQALNELLRPRAQEALQHIGEKQRIAAETLRAKAHSKGTALQVIDYLTMGDRFFAIRGLGLSRRVGLKPGDEKLFLETRNTAAHRGLADARAALRALELSEAVLARLSGM